MIALYAGTLSLIIAVMGIKVTLHRSNTMEARGSCCLPQASR